MPQLIRDSSLAQEAEPPIPVVIRGREFTAAELTSIKKIVETSPDMHRCALSKQVCETLGWYQENGRLKDRACRDVLARLEQRGFIRLPPRRRPPVSRRPTELTQRSEARERFLVRAREITQPSFSIVTGSRNSQRETLWNEYVERYHYLGYGVSVGPHIKYLVEVGDVPIACLAFAGAAWRVAARDRWIGWSTEDRLRNLRFVLNNTRFLMLPWVHGANLASRILALAAKRIAGDWLHRYAYQPLLLETFVHIDRHRGTCYRAANWALAGQTKGRGKMDRHFVAKLPKKAVFVYPLVNNVSRWLQDA